MDTKNFLTSKTMWGLAIVLAFLVFPKLGIGFAAGVLIAAEVDWILQLGGLAWAAWGRIKATTQLTLLGGSR